MTHTLPIGSRVRYGGERPTTEQLTAAAAFSSAALDIEEGRRAGAAAQLRRAAAVLERAQEQEQPQRESLHARCAAEHPAVAAQETTSEPHETVMYDGYFGMRRVFECSQDEQATAAVPVLAALARDMQALAVTPDAKVALARFAARTLTNGVLSDEEDTGEGPAQDPLEAAPEGVAEERWKHGHLLFSLANRRAAQMIEAARGACQRGRLSDAGPLLVEAARDVEAGTAAMELASALSRLQYSREVRPAMCPPRLAVALTGAMNVDHHALREAISGLVGTLHQPFEDLAASCREAALAREALLSADLSDLERHIALSWRLIGPGPALDEADGHSAVKALRSLYLRRLARYAQLMRTYSVQHGGRDGYATVGE